MSINNENKIDNLHQNLSKILSKIIERKTLDEKKLKKFWLSA